LDKRKKRTHAPLGDSDVAEVIERALGARPALCICQVGKVAFSSAFARCGVGNADFARLFKVRELDGKQSNLNHDLRGWVNEYPCVLYAFKGLRYVNPDLRRVSNLISGPNVGDVVRRFIAKVRGSVESPFVPRAKPVRQTQQDATRTTDGSPRPAGRTTAIPRIILPNNPPRGEPGRTEVPTQQGHLAQSLVQPNFTDEFDFDFLLDDLKELESYRDLTASGKAQVLIKRLAKNHFKVRAVPAIKVGHVTEREQRCFQETPNFPPSFHDRSRCSIVPVLLIHKGGLLGLPEFDLALEVDEPSTIGVVPDSFVPAMTFPCGKVAYTIVRDGSIDFPKDEQWFSHPAVRAVLRELTARDKATCRAMARFTSGRPRLKSKSG
jgi:hypothetical protein